MPPTEARLKSSSNGTRDTKVLAPATGIIEKRLVQNGERVTRGQQLFSLVRNDALELTAAVPAKQATAVEAGPGRSLRGRRSQLRWHGRRVSPTIDPTTPVDHRLREGSEPRRRAQRRNVRHRTRRSANAQRRDRRTDAGASAVAGKWADLRLSGRQSRRRRRQIQLGVIDERAGKAEVLSGLNEGDRVIIGNVGMLGRGMQVTVLGTDDQGGAGGGRRDGGVVAR